MSEWQWFTRIILILLALYIVVGIASQLAVIVPFALLGSGSEMEFDGGQFVTIISQVVFIALVVWLLIFKADKWSEMIVSPCEGEEPVLRELPLGLAFRLVVVFGGVLYLYRLIPSLVHTVQSRLLMRKFTASAEPLFGARDVISFAVLGAVTVYLLCGAPHFVRWHVKKTLEMCGEKGENE